MGHATPTSPTFPRRRDHALVVASLGVSGGAAFRSLIPASARRVAALDGKYILGWVGSDCVVAKGAGVATVAMVDLRTGASRTLPSAPPVAAAAERGMHSTQAGPLSSPDGRWLLYRETIDAPIVPAHRDDIRRVDPARKQRWRLLRTDGGETRFYPQSGAFVPIASSGNGRSPCDIYWQPDSQGWLVSYMDARLKIDRYSLESPDGVPEPIAPPDNADWLLGITTDNRLEFWLSPADNVYQVQFVGQQSGAAPEPPLPLHYNEFPRIPESRPFVPIPLRMIDRISGSRYCGDFSLPVLTPDGKNQIFAVRAVKRDPLDEFARARHFRWLDKWLGHRDQELEIHTHLWQEPLGSGSPRVLTTSPYSPSSISQSPDGTKLLFDTGRTVYLLPLR